MRPTPEGNDCIASPPLSGRQHTALTKIRLMGAACGADGEPLKGADGHVATGSIALSVCKWCGCLYMEPREATRGGER